MEGLGSRLGRSSSRYGTSPGSTTLTVFTGPVRKWRRQWVTSEPANNRGKHQLQHQDARPLLLCRWIPVPSTASADSDMPPMRRVRYAPVTVLEELKKECTADGVDANKVSESEAKAKQTVRSDAAAFAKSHFYADAFLLDRKELMMEHAQANQLFLDKF